MVADLSDRPVVIAGGSGFLGSSLARYLTEAGRSVIVLSRNRPENFGSFQHLAWDARTVGDWRHVVRMPIGLPAFTWMVRIGAPLLMRTDSELALYGRYVISRRLQEEGFEFRFPKLAEALSDLL
jgi:NAD dependent epimerase/dehydratase family enzyme